MRYFINKLGDFVPGSRVQVDLDCWRRIVLSTTQIINEKMPPTFDNCDGGLYVGCAGIAYMYYYLASNPCFAEHRQELLIKARNYTDVALSYATSKRSRDVPSAFLLGNGGVFAVGSLVYSDIGEKASSEELNKKYLALSSVCQPVHSLSHGSDELFVGRAGYLCGALLLNRRFQPVQVNL